MSTGVPARVAVVCTLLLGVSIARAERRPVVVVDLAGDATTEQLARQLGQELANHPDLQPISDPAIPGELLGTFEDSDRDLLTRAQTAKSRTEEQLGKFDFVRAEEIAASGQRDLELVAPMPSTLALYAQLAFLRGQAQLGLRHPDEATASFVLVHRLDPAFTPDPARYLPDVVQAFVAATRLVAPATRLAVTGSGRLWIDGRDAGTAPAEVAVAAGPHVVWLTGADRETRAAAVVAVPGKPTPLAIADAPASERLKVRRARAALRYAPDAAARSAAMNQIAELVRVRDAVLVSTVNGKVIVQTWNAGTREHAPGFSALRELGRDKPVDLLAPLAPPRPRDPVADPVGPVGPVKPLVVKEWYERRGIQASLVAGALAAIIGTFLIVRAVTDDTIMGPDKLYQPPMGGAP